MNAENEAQKKENVKQPLSLKGAKKTHFFRTLTECQILSKYFLCSVIVITKDYMKDNRHFIFGIILSKNVKSMLSAKVHWSDKSFLDDCLWLAARE